MDQADHQRQYASQTDYGMREARRLVGDGYGKSRDEQKKARKHQKTKPQQEMLCHQLIDGSAEYAAKVSLELNEQEIPTVTEVKLIGWRKQDKENLEK